MFYWLVLLKFYSGIKCNCAALQLRFLKRHFFDFFKARIGDLPPGLNKQMECCIQKSEKNVTKQLSLYMNVS